MQELLEFQKYLKLTCTEYQFLNNTYLYSINIHYVGHNPQKYTVNKTKKQISKFHQSITKCIFELDPPFDQKYINKQDPSETSSFINLYLNHIQQRLDCLTSRHFINFFQFEQNLTNSKILTKQYVEELTDVDISLKDQQIVDMEWEAKEKILFVISQCKKKTKIQNLFKLFISNEAGMNGSIQMIRFSEEKGEWMNISSQLIEAEPLFLTWNSKSSTLVVSSSIGIYVYMVGMGVQDGKLNLVLMSLIQIDFIEIPGISSVVFDSQIACIYVLSNGINYQGKSKLYAYSIKKESTIEVPLKLQKATSMVFQKTHRRLYITDQEGIKIFKVQNDSQKVIFQNFNKIHTIKHESTFHKLVLSREQKPQYLFGYNKRGFITVFQIKPPEKEFLMNVLTNIQCPDKWNSIERIWSRKIFCVNFQSQLVFISMKNQPLLIKQNGISAGQVKKILFDEQNQRLMYCDGKKLKICQINL